MMFVYEAHSFVVVFRLIDSSDNHRSTVHGLIWYFQSVGVKE
jgi:hypothetical protein